MASGVNVDVDVDEFEIINNWLICIKMLELQIEPNTIKPYPI